ncbi:MAG: hypothetical protein J2P54_04215 [Bradyrhizobiaceae bacterium]|nr:hypothetical protein [Bradyrhizobiaceae bacterium]
MRRAASGARDLRIAALRGLAPGVLALALAACDDDIGEVAVRVASGYTMPSLVIGPDRFLASDGERFKAKDDGSPTILREPPGPTRLRYERGGELVTACSFNVKKNRVVTVTVRAVGRELKCEIMD